MAITFVGSGITDGANNPVPGSAATTPVTAPVPAGIANNDILLLVCRSSANATISAPGDWTQKINAQVGTTAQRIAVFWKRTTGSESNPSVTFTSGQSSIANIVAFRGCVESGDPFDVAGSVEDDGTIAAPVNAGVTTVTAEAMVVCVHSQNDDNTRSSITAAGLVSPASVTARTLSGNPDGNINIIYGIKTSAGATGTMTTTFSASDPAGSVSMALKPSTNVALVGAGTASSTGTAAMTVNQPLVGAATGSSTATGALDVVTLVALAGFAAGSASAAGILDIFTPVALAGAGAASSSGSGDLTVSSLTLVALAGSAAGSSSGLGVLDAVVDFPEWRPPGGFRWVRNRLGVAEPRWRHFFGRGMIFRRR